MKIYLLLSIGIMNDYPKNKRKNYLTKTCSLTHRNIYKWNPM